MFLIKPTARRALASAPENVSGITANCKTILITGAISVTPNGRGKRDILAIGEIIVMRDLRSRLGNVEEGVSTGRVATSLGSCPTP